MLWGAVVVAAGSGTRFGGSKQLAELGGVPLVAWCLRTFAQMGELAEIAVVTEPENVGAVRALLAGIMAEKVHKVVTGGATRQDSVREGLDALSERCTAVIVHDGARPLVRPNDVRSAMNAVKDGRASLLAVPVNDTIKVVDNANQLVKRTLNRQELWAAQTPQCATMRDMRHAHAEAARAHVVASDDAALLERIGLEVVVVRSTPENFKVTVPEDLRRAEEIVKERAPITADEEEILLVEVFIDENLIDAVCTEIEARHGTVDGIDRDLPTGVAIRAYIASDKLQGFCDRFETITSGQAMCTTHFSHFAERGSHSDLAGSRAR